MNKELIHSRFAKHLEDYNKHAKVQKYMAEKLVSLCRKKSYGNILEIGCGTGFLTELATKKLEYKKYTAIDLVEECRNYITKINSSVNFIKADVEEFEPGKYDLIISNAALQWTNDLKRTVNKLKNCLESCGELIFSTFGKENFHEIYSVLGTSLKYYSETELAEIFPDAEIYTPKTDRIMFKSVKDVLLHLKSTGVNAIEPKFWTKGDLKNFEKSYLNLCSGEPTLTYNPIYVHIKNPTIG